MFYTSSSRTEQFVCLVHGRALQYSDLQEPSRNTSQQNAEKTKKTAR